MIHETADIVLFSFHAVCPVAVQVNLKIMKYLTPHIYHDLSKIRTDNPRLRPVQDYHDMTLYKITLEALCHSDLP
jgi:hypothetical protein